jgi:CubicO group peptidase (beta-lactamase class C family)
MQSRTPIPSRSLERSLQAAVIALCIACLFGAWGPNPASAQPQERAELVAALDSAAQAHAADSTVAGVAVAVVQRGDTLLHEGYGQANLEFDVPMPRGAVFEVGSITKQFTAAAILQLAARDSVDLDAPITEYLSGYDTRGHRVTLRHLLHHTSGIRSYTNMSRFDDLSRQDLPRDTLLAMVEEEPFRFAPGTAMSYSNTGYFLLGRIIEEASGQSYASYLEDHLLGPAGMDDSYYCDEEAAVERKAGGYQWSKEGTLRRKDYLDHTWPYSAGSLCSSAPDLVAWNQALHGGEVLPDSMYEAMTTPGRLADGTELRYGMGVGVYRRKGYPLIWHSGGIPGYLSDSRYYPESGLIVVVLQNTLGPRAPESLADSLAGLALGPGEEPTTPYDGDLSELTGRYVGPSVGGVMDLHVEASGDTLLAREAGSEEADTLRHVDGLMWKRGTDQYRFVRAGDQIVELRLDVVGAHYVLRRVGTP